jgi:hypothetical protein
MTPVPTPHPSRIVVGLDVGCSFTGIGFSADGDQQAVKYCSFFKEDPGQIRVPTVLVESDDGRWDFGLPVYHPSEFHYYKDFVVDYTVEEDFYNVTIWSTIRRPQPLLRVMVQVLTSLVQRTMAVLCKECADSELTNRVLWVIGVPTTWVRYGAAFLHEVALQSGLAPDSILLVPKPDASALAAVLYDLPRYRLGEAGRYLVLDCEHTMTSINAYEVMGVKPLRLGTVARPNALNAGGIDGVVRKAELFLRELIPEELIGHGEYEVEMALIREQLGAKFLKYDGTAAAPVFHLRDLLEKKGQLVNLAETYNATHPVNSIVTVNTLRYGFLTPSPELMLSFYEPYLTDIEQAIRGVLQVVPMVKHILLTGSAVPREVLQSRIRGIFPDLGGLPSMHCQDTGTTAQGLIMHGLRHLTAQHTYKLAVVDRVSRVREVVRAGDYLPVGHCVYSRFHPTDADQGSLIIQLLRGEEVLGQLRVDQHSSAAERAVTVTLLFAQCHIEMAAETASGQVFKCRVDDTSVRETCIVYS